MLESFYQSPLQQPGLLWALSLAGILALVGYAKTRGVPQNKTWVFVYALFWSVTALLDAWLTATPVPGLGRFSPEIGQAIVVFFVIAGDYRVFSLLERLEGGAGGRIALAWSFFTPVTSYILMRVFFPTALARWTFLSYELIFLAVFTVYFSIRGGWNSRTARSVILIVLTYYGLWVLADVLILAWNPDFAWGIRILANILYYSAYNLWVFFRLVHARPAQ